MVDAAISQASPLLFQAAAAGTVFPTVTLDAARLIEGELTNFAVLTLSNVVFVSYQTDDGAERYALELHQGRLELHAEFCDWPARCAGRYVVGPWDSGRDRHNSGGTCAGRAAGRIQLFSGAPGGSRRLD